MLAALCAVLLLAGGGGASTEYKFHHIHYRVGDPSSAMSDAVRRFSGTRVIVPGLGVGVRIGNEYLLFDRDTVPTPAEPQPEFAQAFEAATGWLSRRLMAVINSGVPRIAVPDLPLDHVAFSMYSSGDYEAAIQRIEHHARVTVLDRRDDSLLFSVDGMRIEIVRDTSRADVFWCPMHPDVRAPDAGTCSLCGMDLVAIPPPAVGEYRLDVLPQRKPRADGFSGLRLIVREPDTNVMVTRFARVHERFFHLFLIGRDLEFFEHVHPSFRSDGSLVQDLRIPPGEYMVIADFLPQGGTPQMVQRALIAPGGSGSAAVPDPKPDPARRVVRDGLAVTLDVMEVTAGKEAPMAFTVTDAATGAPVTDLSPYLGAPAHMLIVKSDLSDAIHAHPEEQKTGGPTVTFHPLMPAAGDYKLWIQFSRGGKVITFPFWLQVPR
jgi:hypothetical protein